MLKVISVCVNYTDYFSYTFAFNRKYPLLEENLTIITTTQDEVTEKYCDNNNISIYQTNIFYKKGKTPSHHKVNHEAKPFNKAAAINEYLSVIDFNSFAWVLLLDADIILNNVVYDNIKKIIYSRNQEHYNTLYGASRRVYDSVTNHRNQLYQRRNKCNYYGFFQMFSLYNSKINYRLSNELPLLIEYNDASTYDIEFANTMNYFDKKLSVGEVDHIGLDGIHWQGRELF